LLRTYVSGLEDGNYMATHLCLCPHIQTLAKGSLIDHPSVSTRHLDRSCREMHGVVAVKASVHVVLQGGRSCIALNDSTQLTIVC
jgi:hypothetical protein